MLYFDYLLNFDTESAELYQLKREIQKDQDQDQVFSYNSIVNHISLHNITTSQHQFQIKLKKSKIVTSI